MEIPLSGHAVAHVISTRAERLRLDAGSALTDAVWAERPQRWPTMEALVAAYPARDAVIRDLARHRGNLTAESALGAGSTFTLVLPRAWLGVA
jgi:hypothetical protein